MVARRVPPHERSWLATVGIFGLIGMLGIYIKKKKCTMVLTPKETSTDNIEFHAAPVNSTPYSLRNVDFQAI